MVPMSGPRERQFLISEVPLYLLILRGIHSREYMVGMLVSILDKLVVSPLLIECFGAEVGKIQLSLKRR
jgi:hypothetical protein